MKSLDKRSFLVFSVILLLVLNMFCFLHFMPLVHATSGNLVHTVTSSGSIFFSSQRKSFYSDGRYWLFYDNDSTSYVYSSSLDGVTWDTPTLYVAIDSDGWAISLWFDGTYVHIARGADENDPLYYRRGNPNSDGTITFDAEQNIGSTSQYLRYQYPCITVDSVGKVYIAYVATDTDLLQFWTNITKNDNTDGTWSTTAGFPLMYTTGNIGQPPIVVPLTNEYVYIAYPNTSSYVVGRTLTGTTLGSVETIFSTTLRAQGFTAISIGDDVYATFLQTTTYDIHSKKRTGGAWGTEKDVLLLNDLFSNPVLSIDTSDKLYCFWMNTTSDHIMYKTFSVLGDSWDVSPTDWFDESADQLYNGEITGIYQNYDGKLGVAYLTKPSSPFNLKFVPLAGTVSGNVPVEDYVDSQTNVDNHADHGTHNSFAAQKATDWVNDTLTEANTNTTAVNNAENFVDSNTSNIDSHTGHGTSSNFTAQQDANVLYNDTLTEANTGGATSDILTDGFESGGTGNWNENGATTWDVSTNSTYGSPWLTHAGTYMMACDSNDDGSLISDNLNLAGIASFGVQFWYMEDDVDDADEFLLQYWDGAAYDTIVELGLTATEDVWYKYSAVVTDSQYFDATFRLRFIGTTIGTGEVCFVDDVLINKTMSANYELDYEFSWTTADYDEANEYLCIRTNSYSGTAENLGVDVWDGSWKAISTALTVSAWNNISITTNLTGATIYFRFIGKTESSDTAQNTWVIECNLIHTWSVGVNYELDLEEQFTSANFSRTSVELCVRMGAYNTTENIRLDYWNASASAWIVAVATLTTNVWNNVSVKAYTSGASVTFTVRFVGVAESGDTERSSWDKDACLLHTWDITGDTTKPTYSGISTNSTVWATSCNFSVTLADETALANYTFGCNNTGPWVNGSVTTISGTSYKANTTQTLNSTNSNATTPEIIQWEYWFADSSNNLNNTGIQTLTLSWPLSVGWNNVTIFSFDVGFTLAGINASLNYDTIDWTYIIYQNSSTTAQYVFVKNMATNPEIVVYQTTGIILIFCNQAGNWTHTYPLQGGGYGSDPTPYIVVAGVAVAVGLAYGFYRRFRKKRAK